MRWNKSLVIVALVLVGVVYSEEKVSPVVEKEKSAPAAAVLVKVVEASKESEEAKKPEAASEALPVESRVIGNDNQFAANAIQGFNKQGLKHSNVLPTYPIYRHPQDMHAAASANYRGPRPGPQFQAGVQRFQHMNPAAAQFQIQNPALQIQPQVQNNTPVQNTQQVVHKKEEHQKKPTHKAKPQYYPKQSSYASIPDQPIPNSARFVPDPSRNQIIETISQAELQNLQLQPNTFPMMQQPHGVHMPHYNAALMGPQMGPMGPMHGGMNFHGNHNPHRNNDETATVTYEQTEHGFMDRMWGEVMTVRRTMSDNLFIGIPNLFRRFWDSVVGAVTATSRMFTGADSGETLNESLNEFSSRMVEWMPLGYTIVESILENLGY